MRKSKDSKQYLVSKLEKLYMAYAMMLNVSNGKYIGLLQQANTDELILGYRSAETTFSITSRSGASMSLSKAETSLTERADEDECYYCSFIKPHPFMYQNLDGAITNEVQMLSCHVTLLIDNLVRLKFKADPEPGMGHSNQLDMLPITLQGLPKDSLITKNWHDATICDGSVQCPCKKDRKLGRKDVACLV